MSSHVAFSTDPGTSSSPTLSFVARMVLPVLLWTACGSGADSSARPTPDGAVPIPSDGRIASSTGGAGGTPALGGTGGSGGSGREGGETPTAPTSDGGTPVDVAPAPPDGAGPNLPTGGGPASVADLPAGDPAGDKVYTAAGFQMWVPGGIKPLRCNWFTGGSRREIARLLACNQITIPGGRETTAAAAISALAELARVSGHPEVAHLPAVASGYSAATGFPGQMVAHAPDRVMGVFTGGIGGMGPDSPTKKSIPWMHFDGERDGKRDMGATHLATAIEDRAGGALFAKAIRWGEGHEWGDINNLFFPWAYQLIARRTPKMEGTPSAPVPPRPIVESDGWLVDMDAWGTSWPTIAPYAAYTGDKARAGWVADSYTAHVWRAYSAYRSTTPIKIVNPAPQCDTCSPFVLKVGTALTVELSVGAGVTAVELWDGDRKLADVAAPYKVEGLQLSAGVHALIAIGKFPNGQFASKPSVVVITKITAPPSPPPS